MAYYKNKKYIEVTDYDKYHQKTVEEDLDIGSWYSEYWDDNNYRLHHKRLCQCNVCKPDDWDSDEDIRAYRKSNEREKRFQKLFGEANTIRNNIGTYSHILDKSN